MSDEQATQMLQLLGELVYLAQAATWGVGFCAGAISWRLLVLGKNQRRFW